MVPVQHLLHLAAAVAVVEIAWDASFAVDVVVKVEQIGLEWEAAKGAPQVWGAATCDPGLAVPLAFGGTAASLRVDLTEQDLALDLRLEDAFEDFVVAFEEAVEHVADSCLRIEVGGRDYSPQVGGLGTPLEGVQGDFLAS